MQVAPARGCRVHGDSADQAWSSKGSPMTQLGPRPSSAQAARPAAAAKLVGALLCGGASRRMGRDKARLELDGRTLLERASSLLGGSCTRMLLCCGAAPRYTELGVPLVLDAPGESGPLAGVAAALATLAIFKYDDVLTQNAVLGAKLSTALSSLQQHAKVRHFRQQGMIWAFDALIEDPALAASFSRRFFASALKHELLLRPIGQTVYLMPPYILSDAEIQFLAERLATVFEEVVAA